MSWDQELIFYHLEIRAALVICTNVGYKSLTKKYTPIFREPKKSRLNVIIYYARIAGNNFLGGISNEFIRRIRGI